MVKTTEGASVPIISTARKEKPAWKLKYQVAADVLPEETRFLWKPYIPYGALTLLAGPGGVGKSTLICDIASRLSKGVALEGHNRPYPPLKILIVSAEDDISRKIVPKLLEYGADMRNIALSDETFALDDPHVGGIEQAMAEFEATVVVLDPIVAYLGHGMDMHRANETRDFMNKLNKIARGKDKAVIVVAHTRKTMAKNPNINDVMGSADFSNASRSGILVYEYGGQKIFKHDKANWSEKGATLAFSIQSGAIVWQEYRPDGDDTHPVSTRPKKTDKAKDFLIEVLISGPKLAKDVMLQARTLGISEAAITRARSDLVKATRLKEGWIWSLFESNDPNPEATFLLNQKATSKANLTVSLSPEVQAILNQARQKLEVKNG